jgi:2-polyprenyl-6-methoxyphenol hydroxylase-like FAD-dependent oxidoreductase
MESNRRRVIVIGGGIGGTAAGVAMRQAGLDAVVFEQAPERARIEVGGCYVLWYAGVLALSHLGLADKVHALGHPVERFEMCDAFGSVYAASDVGERGRTFGAVPVAVRRADLLRVLTDALDDDALRLGATFRDAVEDGVGVTATFTDGRQERGAVLVGADGLDSRVRAHLHGFEPPRHPGYAHWSGIAEDDGGSPEGVFRVLHGDGARFAFFHLGGGRVCWWCVRNAPAGPSGDVLGGYQALATFFGSWAAPARALLEATPPESIHRRDTLDRPSLKRWGERRVTLLGDAAHAMTFNLGQGAGTSLTDAATLAEHLARAPVLAALRAYEDARRFITTPLVRMSRVVGAAASWDWPLGPKLNELFVRLGPRATPRILERDTRGHPALADQGGGHVP